jgi:hypothetical protein
MSGNVKNVLRLKSGIIRDEVLSIRNVLRARRMHITVSGEKQFSLQHILTVAKERKRIRVNSVTSRRQQHTRLPNWSRAHPAVEVHSAVAVHQVEEAGEVEVQVAGVRVVVGEVKLLTSLIIFDDE